MLLNSVSPVQIPSTQPTQAAKAYMHNNSQPTAGGSLAPLQHDTVNFGMAQLKKNGETRRTGSHVVDSTERQQAPKKMYEKGDAIVRLLTEELNDAARINRLNAGKKDEAGNEIEPVKVDLREIFKEFGETLYPNKNADFVANQVLPNAEAILDAMSSPEGRKSSDITSSTTAVLDILKNNLCNPYMNEDSKQKILNEFIDAKRGGISLGRGYNLDNIMLEYSDSGFDDENAKFIRSMILPNIETLKDVAPRALAKVFKLNFNNPELSKSDTKSFLKAISKDNSVLTFDEQASYSKLLDRENCYGNSKSWFNN